MTRFKKIRPKESDVQKSIESFLKLKGLLVIRCNAGMFKTYKEGKHSGYIKGMPKGFPDLMVLGAFGKATFLEVKRDMQEIEVWKKKSQSKKLGAPSREVAQMRYHELLRTRGFEVHVVCSIDCVSSLVF